MRASLFFLAAILVSSPLLADDTGISAQTRPAVLSGFDADIQSILPNLSSEDFSTREKALRDLQLLLGRQVDELLGPKDPETRARVVALLEFNEGLSRWILDTLALPDERRRALLAFGLRGEMLPVVARIGSRSPATRLHAVHDLSHLTGPIVGDLLAPLLDDHERAVSVAAMEVAWDLEPNAAIVDHLWDRAVEAGFAIYDPPTLLEQKEVMFRGRELGPTFYDNSAYRHMQDSDIACEVLVHINAPQVDTKLKAFFDKVDKAINDMNGRDNRVWRFGANSAPMKNVYKLLDAYRPKSVLPTLFHLATGQVRQPFNGQINNRRYFWSNRTLPLATLLLLTDQNPQDYKVSSVAAPIGTWVFAAQGDEDAAIKKLRDWWAAHPEFTTPDDDE